VPRDPIKEKAALRTLARQRREDLPERTEKSRQILESFVRHFSPQPGQCLATYVGIAAEVATADWLQSVLPDNLCGTAGRRESRLKIAVPYTLPQELRLFHLRDWSQLQQGRFGLWEPPEDQRTPEQQVPPGQVDLFLVPGLAFDRRGNRLGYGKGYYDRLLRQKKPQSLAIALAFEVQMFPHVPAVTAHDIPVDYIITEQQLIKCGK